MELIIDKDNVSYDVAADMLYITVDGRSLDICDEIEDIWEQGITVMKTDNKISGIEIYDFHNRYGKAPIIIAVNSKESFSLNIPFKI